MSTAYRIAVFVLLAPLWLPMVLVLEAWFLARSIVWELP